MFASVVVSNEFSDRVLPGGNGYLPVWVVRCLVFVEMGEIELKWNFRNEQLGNCVKMKV